MYDQNQAHYLVVTGILVKNGKFLITKRAGWEKAFPNRWTVPGGKLKVLDYALRKMDTQHHWYNVFEDVLEIKNIGYVTSMVYIRDDKIPCIIVSLYAEPFEAEPKIKLCDALTEFAWVDLEEAKKYDLIDGIYDELVILDNHLKNGNAMKWEKAKPNRSP